MLEKFKSFYKNISSTDVFSPAIFFPFALFLYHLFGNIFDQYRSDVFELKYSTYPLIFTALIVYYVVFYIVNKKNIMLPSITKPWFSKLFHLGVIALTLVGFLSLGYMLLTGQMGILDESIRRNMNPKLNFLSDFFLFGYLILITEYISKKNFEKKKAIFLLFISGIGVMFLYVLVGYRTNLFLIFFTLFLFFHYFFKRFNFKVVASILLIVSISFSLFGYMRTVNEDKNIAFNKDPIVNLDSKTQAAVKKVDQTPEWVRVITAEFVNSKIVLSRIIQYTDEKGSLHGQLHLSAFETLLPGKNLSPRMIITNKINNLSENGVPITRPDRTTTPSLLGQFFLDGGYVLLVIGMAFVSFILTSLYNRLKTYNTSNTKIAYSLLLTLFIMCIHTGLLDIIFFIFFVAMVLYSMITKKSTANTN